MDGIETGANPNADEALRTLRATVKRWDALAGRGPDWTPERLIVAAELVDCAQALDDSLSGHNLPAASSGTQLAGSAQAWRAVREAAERVVTHAYGIKLRHARDRLGRGRCRDTCIPCGLMALRTSLYTLRQEQRWEAEEEVTHRSDRFPEPLCTGCGDPWPCASSR